jgi:hypothetical protein
MRRCRLRQVVMMVTPGAAFGQRCASVPALCSAEASARRPCLPIRTTARRGSRLAAEAQLGAPTTHGGPSWHLADGQKLSLFQTRSSQVGVSQTQAPGARGAASDGEGGAGAAPEAPADVRIVDNKADADAVVQLLLAPHRSECPTYDAVDTEARLRSRRAHARESARLTSSVAAAAQVADIDVLKETPVGHGRITCFSVYCGPEMDFGDGKRRLWVDVLKGGPEVLLAFKPYLESHDIQKARAPMRLLCNGFCCRSSRVGCAQVWHNYAFDRHIFENEGIQPHGFGGDTMHMARLWSSSRTGKGYSLEALTKDDEVMKDAMDIEGADEGLFRAKQSMKELFAKPNVKKDGTDGRLFVLPDVTTLQTSPETRYNWIDYSTLDAQATWLLRESLECKLRNMPVEACKILSAKPGFTVCATMWDFYQQNWKPFGELLVDLETNGMLVDKEQLQVAETLAQGHQQDAENHFRSWAEQRCEGARWMNVGSGAQVRPLVLLACAGPHTLCICRLGSCCTRACPARQARRCLCRSCASSRCPTKTGRNGMRPGARARRQRSSARSSCAASCRRPFRRRSSPPRGYRPPARLRCARWSASPAQPRS